MAITLLFTIANFNVQSVQSTQDQLITCFWAQESSDVLTVPLFQNPDVLPGFPRITEEKKHKHSKKYSPRHTLASVQPMEQS